MNVVIIGGTGLIGSKLVTRLRERGHRAVPASPETGVNTLSGEGLAEALTGAAVVVDVSNSPKLDESAIAFFETSTGNLLAAEAAAGVGHHVALSVVGTDRLAGSGYFRGKIAQEKLIRRSSIPYSIVHATQFFEFFKTLADTATARGTVRLPPVLIQPMAADDVAAAVYSVAIGSPVNGIVEVAGPQQFRLDEVVWRVLRARGDAREVIADPNALYSGTEVSARTLMPRDDASVGETHLDDWLDRAVVRSLSSPSPSPSPDRATLGEAAAR